jgi:beta-1,4-mannosyl-glycoprotein beta-1,4-N-acetylglucosaminyltransferase
MVYDCFPFFNELDVLEIRLNELAPVVDKFVIIEAAETYGGQPKPFNLRDNWNRFKDFHAQIDYRTIGRLYPNCTDRVTGRRREAFQRDLLWVPLFSHKLHPEDVVIFSDCDEIPSADAVQYYLDTDRAGIRRFKQHSFYYNVQTLVDYGHDFASRARIGTARDLLGCGCMYDFRMHEKDTCPAIENGGWHFSYFGGPEKIKTKVAALSPFLSEYKLFGDDELARDIEARRDLHHRRCEMPAIFADVQTHLPEYLEMNRERFSHFFRKTVAA